MEDESLKIRIQESSSVSPRAASRRRGFPWRWGVVIMLILGVLGVLLALPSSEEAFEETKEPEAAENGAQEQSDRVQDALVPAEPETVEEEVVDDGKSLWASPTAGLPIELSYLSPGTQLVFHLRAADLLKHPEGEKVLAALGPWGQLVLGELAGTTGAQLHEIETLLLGLRLARSGKLEYSLCLQLLEPWTDAQLAVRLPRSRLGKYNQQTYREQSGRATFLASQSEGKVLVSCSQAAAIELIEQGDQPPLFPRELQRVLKQTDSLRIATLAFAGKFLQISGEKFLQGAGEPLGEALIDFLGDEVTATALSAHWNENFFLELQSTVTLDQQPHRFAALLENRVANSSDQIEDTIFSQLRHPYGRKVLARFPSMLRKLGNYTRSGETEGLSVLRTYLPINAGHNLLMAAELLLNTTVGPESDNQEGLATVNEPQTIAERLQQTTSLVFPKETLQKALELLSEDLGVTIEIAGRDLQLEGITKNQSFGIELRNRPAAEILLAVLQRANPDRAASGPTDNKQKLVYVVREPTGQQPGAIVVTTRVAATRRGEQLPDVFVP